MLTTDTWLMSDGFHIMCLSPLLHGSYRGPLIHSDHPVHLKNWKSGQYSLNLLLYNPQSWAASPKKLHFLDVFEHIGTLAYKTDFFFSKVDALRLQWEKKRWKIAHRWIRTFLKVHFVHKTMKWTTEVDFFPF